MNDMILIENLNSNIMQIRLNRPEKRNAFNIELIDQLAAILTELPSETRGIILTGTGSAFCAGVDLGDREQSVRAPVGSWERLTRHIYEVAYAFERLDIPALAAVNGPAVGAGMDLSLMCDMRFAAHSARFSEGYIRAGLFPGDGGCFYLSRLVGVPKALDLLWSGRFIEADEALRLGIVDATFDDEDLLKCSEDYLVKILEGNNLAIRLIKRACREAQRSDLHASLELAAAFQGLMQSVR